MKIKYVDAKNRKEDGKEVSIDIFFRIDNNEKVYKGTFIFGRKLYTLINSQFEDDFNEKEKIQITDKLLRLDNKRLLRAVTRPNGKEKPLVTEAYVSTHISKYINRATVEFKLQGEDFQTVMYYYSYNIGSIDSSAMYMFIPLNKYADSPEDIKEINRQIFEILKQKGESIFDKKYIKMISKGSESK